LTLAAILFVFIKFFIFGEAPSADERASTRAAARKQRTLSHSRQRTLSVALRPQPSVPVLRTRNDGGLTVQKILEKTYYNVRGHQPESLDWFNVLIAQTIAQLRADALEDEAVLTSLTTLLNGSSRPDFLDEIRVTEISLGDEFPIFSNCRVMPVDESGNTIRELTGARGERLQARIDVDLSDVLTLGIETKLVLNYPKPSVAVLPVALAVSVVRFSGTLSLSFSPSSQAAPVSSSSGAVSPAQASTNDENPTSATGQSPTTLTFTFLDDYRLDLSVRSLIGSRARLQDVPKIAQLVEAKMHQFLDDRCVEPRFQQIVLPSLWPRKKNTRGGDEEAIIDETVAGSQVDGSTKEPAHISNKGPLPMETQTPTKASIAGSTAEQRTRAWAAQHSGSTSKRREEKSELELAGDAMREFEEKARKKEQRQVDRSRDESGLRMRAHGQSERGDGLRNAP
jgi:maintenance of morphology protein 1